VRTVFRWWTIVIPFLVVVQISLVGVGAFHGSTSVDDKFGDKVVPTCDPSCGKAFKDSFENWFAPHVTFGYLLVLSVLLYALFSLATRDRRLMKIGGITAGLFILQVLLAYLAYGVNALGWLHPLNALVILGYTGRNALVAWREREATEAAPAAVPAA
jgi:heme A synthase